MSSWDSPNLKRNKAIGDKIGGIMRAIYGAKTQAAPTEVNQFYSPLDESVDDFESRVANTPGTYDFNAAPSDSPFILNNEVSKKFYGNLLEERRKASVKAMQDAETATTSHQRDIEKKDLDYQSDYFKRVGLPFKSGMSYSDVPIQGHSNVYGAAQAALEKQTAADLTAKAQAEAEQPYISRTVAQKFNTGETKLEQEQFNLKDAQEKADVERPYRDTIARNKAKTSAYFPFQSALNVDTGEVINVDKYEEPIRNAEGERTGQIVTGRKASFTPISQGRKSPQNPPADSGNFDEEVDKISKAQNMSGLQKKSALEALKAKFGIK